MAVNGVDPYHQFVALHKNQLESSVVPQHFWPTLFKKLTEDIFDAGQTFSLMQVLDEDDEEVISWKVVVSSEDGVKLEDSQHIYLVDHAWTFRSNSARAMLNQYPNLLERMANLMEINDQEDKTKLLEDVMEAKWKWAQTYSVGSASTVEDRMPCWYVMDEFGSRIQHNLDANMRLVPFFNMIGGWACSILFPVRDIEANEEIFRDYLEGPESQDAMNRKSLMNIWSSIDMTDVDWRQAEPDSKFFESSRTNETIPKDDCQASDLPSSTPIKVYAEYQTINDNLKDERFEIVNDKESADIWWLTEHFKTFKEFFDESPQRRINQFPFEHVLTIKDLLPVVCRRMATKGQNEPDWLPTTFNLKTELAQFVSYYQQREKDGLDNHWIVKPWNLARGLGIQVTKSLPHILKMIFSGPKIVQKYLHDPVLFERPEIGQVKFDIRYILLLKSVRPLKVYAYQRFWLRFANQKFELNEYDIYEKHFTVMNYNEAHLEQMFCHDFIQKFEAQYPQFKWDDVQQKIFKMFKEVFEGATKLPPPQGLANDDQSRAMYAADLMLKWNETHDEMIPQILEINWGPDCNRACQYYPEYFDNVFNTLFLDKPQNVTLL